MPQYRFIPVLAALALACGGAAAQSADPVGELRSLLSNGASTPGDHLLEPEAAFAVRAIADGPDLVAIEYQVAEGYYLYDHKFAFASDSEGVTLGTPWLPAGERSHDEFFGDIEIHRGLVTIGLPLSERPPDLRQVTLVLESQGCADIGVCYPPLTQRVSLELPPPSSAAAPTAVDELATALNLGGSDPELLDPDKAFAISVDGDRAGQVRVDWDIADGYYLYQERMSFAIEDGAGLRLGAPRFSETKIKEDEFFGRMAVFYHRARAELPVVGDAAAVPATLRVSYQGCAEIGVCYPPITKAFRVNLSGGSGAAMPAAPAPTSAPLAEQDRIAAALAANSTWLTVLTFFGLGLLLTFTPCVLPMVPILSSIIAGQGEGITTARAFFLSLTYVLAMALTYTVAGVLVGLSGENVQAMFQNPWVLGVFAGIFVLLSLSMFGFYELQMPAAVQSRLTTLSNSQRGGTYTGVGIMGFASALIVGPCVTAPLVGALIYIAQTGDALLGGLALFALSLGMGVPLLVIGTSAGKLVPRAGPWMDAVKAVFGVMLLGVAIWLLERVLPMAVTMALWASLLIVSAIYLGALEPIRESATGWMRLWKGLGLISLTAGVLLLIGAAAGGNSMLQPLKGMFVAGTPGSGAAEVHFRQVKGLDGLRQALDEAGAAGRSVMLDFYADWCISCKEMEAFTFTDPGVRAALANTVWLQTDVTRNDDEDKALLRHFGLFGPPAILFFRADGTERRNYRVVGFMSADRFRLQVEAALETVQSVKIDSNLSQLVAN